MIWVGILNMFFAFFVYLLMAGAGLRRAYDVVLNSVLMGLALGIVVATLPYLYFPTVGQTVFMHVAFLGCLIGLMTQSLRRAREYLVAKSSTLEVVCLNVLAVAFGAPPDTFAFFEMFTELGYVLLVNPLGFWLPAEFGWLKTLLSLWPTAIALWAASGEPAGRGIRLFLMWWVQLMYATWVLPSSFGMLANPGEVTRYYFADLVLATIGLVRVLLTMLALHISLWGSRDDEEFDLPKGVTARSAFQQVLVDGMMIQALPGWAYAIAGLGAYLLVDVARHFLPPEGAVTGGFFTILGVVSLIEAVRPRAAGISKPGLASPLLALPLLGAGLLVLSGLPLMPRYVWTAEVQPSNPSLPPPLPGKPRRAAPSAKEAEVILYETGDHPLDCKIENGAELLLNCVSETWPLASVAHSARVRAPLEVSAPLVTYEFDFLDLNARCVEYEVLDPEAQPRNLLLLVFLNGAALQEQVAWVAGPQAGCRGLRVAVFPDALREEPTVLFAANEQMRRLDLERWEKVITLRPQPLEEAELGTTPDPAGSSSAAE